MKRVLQAIAVDCFFAGVLALFLVGSVGDTIQKTKRKVTRSRHR